MKTELERKVAVVTGGTSGIGAAVAQRLVAKNWRVVSVSRRHLLEEPHALAAVSPAGTSFSQIAADLSSEAGVKIAAQKIRELVPRIDLLLNSAGSIGDVESLDQVTYEQALESFRLHSLAPLFLTREVLGLLRVRGGSVVHVGSIYGEIADAEVSAYCLSKSCLVQLTKMQAREYAPNIRVNVVLPGHIDTPMTRGAPNDFVDAIVAKTPLASLGQAADVASLVEFLGSEDARFITGAAMRIDGGYMAGAGLVS